ncbi:hypothetical protein ACFLYU_03005 [Candidatus Dependentiae bacterium]
MVKRKIVAGVLGLFLFVSPINVNASALSQNSYARKALRIIGGVGLISLFAERMISYTKNEQQLDLVNATISIVACYQGFKMLAREI